MNHPYHILTAAVAVAESKIWMFFQDAVEGETGGQRIA
jgi:hypothetical protein